MAVRDSAIVTVLARGCEVECSEAEWLDPDGEMRAESVATREACQKILAEALLKKKATTEVRLAYVRSLARTRRPR